MNEATLTRRSMIDRLKFLPRLPDGFPAAVVRRLSRCFLGFARASRSEILGTATPSPDEPADGSSRGAELQFQLTHLIAKGRPTDEIAHSRTGDRQGGSIAGREIGPPSVGNWSEDADRPVVSRQPALDETMSSKDICLATSGE